MSSPRIVVVMPCFNEERYLTETIPAVLGQEMSNLRLVILDNGSTDGSNAILRGFERYDPRITLLRAERNLAPGRVGNLLTRVAFDLSPDCRWVVAAGADDVMHPDYLEAILAAAGEHPHANCIFSPWQWIGHPEKGVKRFQAFDPETCHAVHQVPAWCAITRELWQAIGQYDEGLIAADWEWVVRKRYDIRAHQLERPYISLRVRDGARVTQSEEVHWPSLHRLFCEMVGKPIPTWAKGASRVC